MSEMIELVAVAIERESRMRIGTADSNVNAVFEGAKLAARAAIKAMREPTDAMLNAAETAASWENELDERTQASVAWKAMIDEALKNDATPT
jgi:hypothetical protein